MTLVAGDSEQLALIHFAARADSVIPDDLTPISPADVSLELVEPSGARHPLVPGNGAGVFRASLSVAPGLTYALEGSLAGRRVEAVTTVPALFRLIEPAADTVRVDDAVPCVPFSFDPCFQVAAEVDGATAIEYRLLGTGSGGPVVGAFLGSTGILQLWRWPGFVAGIYPVIMYALNEDAAAWGRWQLGNIPGVIGVFGAALKAQKWVELQ
jgi:hypothetical protein